jgi:predicted nucleic acid-binding protein
LGTEKEVIHLDANFLIRAADRNSPVEMTLQNWLQQGETLATSSIAWAEFLNGPVRLDQVEKMDDLIEERIIPFGRIEAQIAAALFNQTGRKRGSRPDCSIAATAIGSKAPLATFNRQDFTAFVPLGLRLA